MGWLLVEASLVLDLLTVVCTVGLGSCSYSYEKSHVGQFEHGVNSCELIVQ